jgi:hypothetical protein
MSAHDPHSKCEKPLYWASSLFAGLALLLFLVNMCLLNGNRQRQEEIDQRQTAINEGVAREQVTTKLSQVLAEIAVKQNDDGIRDVLRAEGAANWRDALKKSPPLTPVIKAKKKPE